MEALDSILENNAATDDLATMLIMVYSILVLMCIFVLTFYMLQISAGALEQVREYLFYKIPQLKNNIYDCQSTTILSMFLL